MDTERNGTLKFKMTLGALIRGDVVKALKNKAFDLGLDIDIDESKGLIYSDYRVKVKGAESKLYIFQSYKDRLSRLV